MSNIKIDHKNLYQRIIHHWEDEIIDQLKQYIQIPNKSPAFDADWKAHGYMNQAMQLIINWCQQQAIEGMQLEMFELPGRTPLLFIEIPAYQSSTQDQKNILLYGHMDKQPEMSGWQEPELGPWKAVLREGKLYGRGGADDGYAVFAALSAIANLQAQNIPHAGCIILIEASEESGSVDLPDYLDFLKEKIGNINLVICLDSGCGNYQQLWSTTSLRGLISATLDIAVLKQGIHSGLGGGVVPSPMQILRILLDRIEDSTTGKIILKDFNPPIPQQFIEQAQETARILEESFYQTYPFLTGVEPIASDMDQLILNRTWQSSLTITGICGIPAIHTGGNVSLPTLSVKLSMRIPPNCEPERAFITLQETIEQNPPFAAKVQLKLNDQAAGWQAPTLADWLAAANDHASKLFFGQPAAYIGEGGTIPFMGMLGKIYPHAQFLITGVLGPLSNAHGPNEFLHIDMAKKLTACVAVVIAKHHEYSLG